MREAHSTIVFGAEHERLRIVAVADTHSRPHPLLGERIAALAPDHVLLAGDIGDLSVVTALERHAPVLAVRGNIDVHAPDLPDVAVVDIGPGGVRLVMLHIAVAGQRLRADVRRLVEQKGGSLVVCGHSHVPFLTQERGVTVFNPGSAGPRRFDLPILFGVIDVTHTGVTFRHVLCETGLAWKPERASNRDR